MSGITGKTSIMIMLADPVSHIRGTVLINDGFAALGLDAAIVPVHVIAEDLESVLNAARAMRNLVGLGITIPHKINVIPYLDELTLTARRSGAVNFVRRLADGSLVGTNTDGAGFIAGLELNDVRVDGRSALLVGAGGVARAIASSLADAGVKRLLVMNRDHVKATELATLVRTAAPCCDVQPIKEAEFNGSPEIDIIINGTSLGMAGSESLPVPFHWLRSDMTVAEVVVSPVMTPLLSAAQAIGCRIVPGAEMLKPQPAMVAEFFGLTNSIIT